jgi:hypothetical protein
VKTGGCVGAGCFSVTLGMALMILVFISAAVLHPPAPDAEPPAPEITPETAPRREPPRARGTARPPVQATPTPDRDRFLSHPGESRQFSQQDDGALYHLHYGFVDYSGRHQEVGCSVSRDAVARARRSFGWDKTEVEGELDATLQKMVDHELQERGLTPYVAVTIHGDGERQWRGRIPPDAETSARVEAFSEWLQGDFNQAAERTEAQIFKRHGLLLRNSVVSIDYASLASAATEDLRNCYDALEQAGGPAASERYFMGLLLAFMQELTYAVPPDTIGGRDLFGLWVPTQVMADGKGDCDSKSTAFAALWRRRHSRMIIILVPGHALVGVEAKPGPGESFVQVGNRYYILCEVAGPAKLPPGSEAISGSFEFVAIDPV